MPTSVRAVGYCQRALWVGWISLGLWFAAGVQGSAPAAVNGLAAAYGFDQGTGDILRDDSGNGNSGILQGAGWAPGKFGSGLSFDGLSAAVRIPDSSSLDLNSGMTLEAWVYPTSNASGWRDVIYKVQDIYYLEAASATKGAPAVGGTFSSSPLSGPSVLPLNTWTHLAASYDGAALRLYVNGALVASRAQSGAIRTSTGPLMLGGDSVFGQYFAGRIDEVRIYNRALSVAEIQADMTTPIEPLATDPVPPVVALLAPEPGARLSLVASLLAEATDDGQVVGVEFFVDGASVGAALVSPFAANWDTTTVSNGLHTLWAVAQDSGGNQSTSAPVVVSTLNPAFVNEVVVPGIVSAVTLLFLPDGRMLVGELPEKIWVVQPGASSADPAPFLQLDGRYLFGEQGLVDITLDPHFDQNGFYYVFYAHAVSGQANHDRVSRFTAAGNQTLAGSEFVVWEDPRIAASEHHGGALGFGPDGMIYISTGDHFNAADAQTLDNYHGKILRLNRDGSVPTDNPFFDGDGPNLDAIWAYGLRNPYRLSFDALTGRLYIGDVGGNDVNTSMEEVNLGAPGANYGWPLCEGGGCGVPGTTDPIYSYPHLGRDACVTGGFVYRGRQFPGEYYGSYFFGDYVQNWIRRLTFDAANNVSGMVHFEPANDTLDGPYGDPVKLVEGPDGALYYVDLGFNDQHVPNPAAIRRIRYVGENRPPVAIATAAPLTGEPPLLVAFSSDGSIDPERVPLAYTWTFGDGAASMEANPTHEYVLPGTYVARLSVSDGSNATLSADVQITVGLPPTAAILAPSDGAIFRAGDQIPFFGEAYDGTGNPLPASAFAWSIGFHHEGHIHPGGIVAGATNGLLEIPVAGHDFAGATSYEISLSVTDSNNLKASRSVTVFPDKVNVLFDSAPAGLDLDLDGIRKTTPFLYDTLIGFRHTVFAPEQIVAGTNFYFQSWSDGESQLHTIVVPAQDESLTVRYAEGLPAPAVTAGVFSHGLRVRFDSLAGHLYGIEWSPTLFPEDWVQWGDVLVGTGGTMEVFDPLAAEQQRFYRVVLLPGGD